jgi:excisionase family DNA binding protein
MALEFEQFVDADTVAAFLSVKRKTVLEWARKGMIPAHSWGRGRRKVWRFLISEISSQTKPIQAKIDIGSPEIARLEKKYG